MFYRLGLGAFLEQVFMCTFIYNATLIIACTWVLDAAITYKLFNTNTQ